MHQILDRPAKREIITASDAETFRAYYKSKGWAETETYDGEFCIMQIETIEIRAF